MNPRDLSFLHLIANASLVVQLVMLVLLSMSFVSWWFIFHKWFVIRAAKQQTEDFEQRFHTEQGHGEISAGKRRSEDGGSLEKICIAGLKEFQRLRGQRGQDTAVVLDGTRRAMRATFQREMDDLESHLNFLASVGSVSPYIGLLGTVWGIMNSFRGLANVSQATLQNVAPGIAEALIATAIGLFAAIPAVLAYNAYVRDVDRLASRFESFMEEFSNILQRQPPQ